ncbi:hypothetical protein [Arthrobacter sp. EpRS71]|uniref:hypothetical protein n=1 Tax=Arthrobacter sp. EpRS71 TaxID=1743141 RepID=UPI0012E3A865|nr:hypothetical protein [Arthrobacter sp. EpRS71]
MNESLQPVSGQGRHDLEVPGGGRRPSIRETTIRHADRFVGSLLKMPFARHLLQGTLEAGFST